MVLALSKTKPPRAAPGGFSYNAVGELAYSRSEINPLS